MKLNMDHKMDKVLKMLNYHWVILVKFRLESMELDTLNDMVEEMMNTCNKDLSKEDKMMGSVDVHTVNDEQMNFAFVIVAFDGNDDVENDLLQSLLLLNHEYANLN